jgi:ribonucleoside-diphosphate reductase alpha chain
MINIKIIIKNIFIQPFPNPNMIMQVRRRDGTVVPFDKQKIISAIHKALVATKTKDETVAKELADKVVAILEKRFPSAIPGVEDIQNIVEEVLMTSGLTEVAKAYIKYRAQRAQLRAAKATLGVSDELKLSLNASAVLERRYLLKDQTGKVIETPGQMFRRVAKAIAAVDEKYGDNPKKAEEEFYNIMTALEFLPNSPTLFNAGTPLGQLSACFVLPVEDSLVSIFKAVSDMTIIEQSGGGVGFSFSALRPKGDIVRSTMGVASGPVSFMRVFDVTTDVIKQGGRRRGAMMGILSVHHPDIVEFVTAKGTEGFLTNFNLSVAITDRFMTAVRTNQTYPLINPRTGEVVKRLRARDVWDLIITMAWRTGDPGVVFIDEINRHNPTPEIGRIEATNPCGEQPLLPYESCNLGSIVLSRMVKQGKNQKYEIDWDKLKKTVHVAVHFLDNVIDANRYPIPEIEKITKANRKIGLGVMGFADLLLLLNVPYNSSVALKLANKIMRFINDEAHKASFELAEKRGNFPNFHKSIWTKKYSRLRNATCTTIAPTGSLSIIAGCSSGIEPLFAVSFVRNVLEGTRLLEVNPIFEQIARSCGFYSEELMAKIARTGSVQGIKEIPEDVRRIFVTAHDISPEWHVKMQAAFQAHTDNAVSKTINFAHDATIEQIRSAFELAYKLKCKGLTVYRYGSKRQQVLYFGSILSKEQPEFPPYVSVEAEYSGGCPTPLCPSP